MDVAFEEVDFAPEFREWRLQARRLLAGGVPPEAVIWAPRPLGSSATATPLGTQASLFETLPLFGSPSAAPQTSAKTSPTVHVPKSFLKIAELAALHRDDSRWGLLYRVLFRITHGEPHLLAVECDADVAALGQFQHAVSRDMHKMRAFLRFRKTGEEYVAWHRPDHHIIEANAPFFVRRFGSMPFAILSPDRSAYWDRESLRFGPGVPRPEPLNGEPEQDELEQMWLSYYASVFNPARIKVKAMKNEMPVRYWATMPETALIPSLLREAGSRVAEMAKMQPDSAARFVPESHDLPVLAQAAKGCEGCSLYRYATQTVFGEGPKSASVMLVGEQPGDSEDRNGHPFVGPAGRLLDQALEEAGVNRAEVYVTNAVKHFKFVERGKRRLHQKPGGIEISACRPWLEAEAAAIRPEVIVCLGGTAAQSVLGRAVKVLTERGKLMPHHWARQALITIHPSAILRAGDDERQAAQYRSLVDDLRLIPAAALPPDSPKP